MDRHENLRLPAWVVVLFGAAMLACASTDDGGDYYYYDSGCSGSGSGSSCSGSGGSSSGGSSSGGSSSGGTAPTTGADTIAPAMPAVAREYAPSWPSQDRATPPAHPWQAPARKYATAAELSFENSSDFWNATKQRWQDAGAIFTAPANKPPFQKLLDNGAKVYSGYTTRYYEGGSTQYATGWGIITFNPDFLQKGFSDVQHSTSDPGTFAWAYYDTWGHAHGPYWENWQPGPTEAGAVHWVGEKRQGKTSGEYRSYSKTGYALEAGVFADDARVGIWRYFDEFGRLQKRVDESDSRTGLYETYLPGGAISVQGFMVGGNLSGDVTWWNTDGTCSIARYENGETSGWRTDYAAAGWRLRDVWIKATGTWDGPGFEYDAQGNVVARFEYSNGTRTSYQRTRSQWPAPASPVTGHRGWRQVSTGAHPAAAIGCAAAGMVCNDGWLLFGGRDQNTVYGETWFFDGHEWKRLKPAGGVAPCARTGAALDADIARSVWVLFGGQDAEGRALGDTWEFDGTAWRCLQESGGPAARWGSALASQSSAKRMVLFGGENAEGKLSDTWAWSDGSWAPIAEGSDAPVARSGASMVHDSSHSVLVLYGGSGGEAALSDTWVLYENAWSPVEMSGSPGPDAALAVSGIAFGAVLVGGSERLDAFNPVIVNEHGDWQSFALDRPAARKGFCLGTDWLKDRHIVYGGMRNDGSPLHETWTLETLPDRAIRERFPDEFKASIQAPGFRYLRTRLGNEVAANRLSAWDAKRGVTVCFGGDQDGAAIHETWEFDGADWKQCATGEGLTAGGRRWLYYDTKREQVMLIQELVAEGEAAPQRHEQYAWDGQAWTRVAALEGGPRGAAVLCFDANRGVLVWLPEWASADVLWELHEDGWKRLEGKGGPVSEDFSLAFYDAARKRVVALQQDFLGESADLLWFWDGENWSSQETGNSLLDAAFGAPPLAVDTKRGVVWILGSHALWKLEGTTFSEYRVPERLAYIGATGWVNPATGKLYWQGGWANDQYVNDTWEVDPDTLEPAEDE